MSEKFVFKCLLNVSTDRHGFDPTIASIRSWLNNKGLNHSAPNTIYEPFIIEIDLNSGWALGKKIDDDIEKYKQENP